MQLRMPAILRTYSIKIKADIKNGDVEQFMPASVW